MNWEAITLAFQSYFSGGILLSVAVWFGDLHFRAKNGIKPVNESYFLLAWAWPIIAPALVLCGLRWLCKHIVEAAQSIPWLWKKEK